MKKASVFLHLPFLLYESIIETMNNFIENVSRFDIHTGTHSDAGPNSMLIQINGSTSVWSS